MKEKLISTHYLISFIGIGTTLMIVGSYLYNLILSISFKYKMGLIYDINDYLGSVIEYIGVAIIAFVIGWFVIEIITPNLPFSNIQHTKKSKWIAFITIYSPALLISVIAFTQYLKTGIINYDAFLLSAVVVIPQIIIKIINRRHLLTNNHRQMVLTVTMFLLVITTISLKKVDFIKKGIYDTDTVLFLRSGQINISSDQIITISSRYIVCYESGNVVLYPQSDLEKIVILEKSINN